MARLAFEMALAEGEEPAKEGEQKPAKPKEELLDGMPESFIGPLLADLVAHEVGHTARQVSTLWLKSTAKI